MNNEKKSKPSFSQLFLRDDAAGVTGGKWFSHSKGSRFLIVSLNNPAYQSAFTELIAKSDSAEARASDEFRLDTYKLMAKHILKGWQGIYDENGQELPYSSGLAFDLLKSSKDFSDWVTRKAMNSSSFLDDAEQDLKN